MEKPADPARMTPIAMDGKRAIAFDCELILGPDGPFPMTGVTHLRFADLSADLLAATDPGLIFMPLFATSFDAMSAVELLEALGYIGKLTVLAPELPKPALVENELRSLGPGARLTLISP